MKPIKNNFATSILAIVFASLLSTTNTLAIEPSNNDAEAVSWYQIEVILFKNTQNFEQDKEHITIDMAAPSQKFVLVKGDPMVNSQLQRLNTKDLKLTKSFNAMSRSKNYNVLEFAGWKQPLLKEQPGIPLIISSGQKYGQHHELEGKLTFRKSRYLHLHADLYLADYMRGSNINMQSWLLEDDNIATHITQLHEADSNQDVETNNVDSVLLTHIVKPSKENPTQSQQVGTEPLESVGGTASAHTQTPTTNYIASNISHMNETRRMRSGEIHYLDHPKFGLLVTIEPTDPPFVYND